MVFSEHRSACPRGYSPLALSKPYLLPESSVPDTNPKPIGYLLNTWQFVSEIKDQRSRDWRGARYEPLYSAAQLADLTAANMVLTEQVVRLKNEISNLERQFARIAESF